MNKVRQANHLPYFISHAFGRVSSEERYSSQTTSFFCGKTLPMEPLQSWKKKDTATTHELMTKRQSLLPYDPGLI